MAVGRAASRGSSESSLAQRSSVGHDAESLGGLSTARPHELANRYPPPDADLLAGLLVEPVMDAA